MLGFVEYVMERRLANFMMGFESMFRQVLQRPDGRPPRVQRSWVAPFGSSPGSAAPGSFPGVQMVGHFA